MLLIKSGACGVRLRDDPGRDIVPICTERSFCSRQINLTYEVFDVVLLICSSKQSYRHLAKVCWVT